MVQFLNKCIYKTYVKMKMPKMGKPVLSREKLQQLLVQAKKISAIRDLNYYRVEVFKNKVR